MIGTSSQEKNQMSEKLSVYEVVTQRIIEFIEQNNELPWRKSWATVESAQQNFKSRKPYQGINAVLTGMSGFSSPLWMTFKQVKETGGNVKKGEKSTPVIFWSTLEKKVKDNDEDEEKTKKFGFYRLYHIFNAQQIEGIEFPEIVKPIQSFDPIEEAEKVIRDMPKCPPIRRDGNGAFYSPVFDVVTIPDTFFTPEELYSALFHELAHSTGHPSRLNRFKEEGDDHKFGSQTYSREELVAEMSSAFVLNTLGIANESTDKNSAAYVKSWLRALRNDPQMVVTAASKAGKAANYIMNKEEGHVVGDK